MSQVKRKSCAKALFLSYQYFQNKSSQGISPPHFGQITILKKFIEDGCEFIKVFLFDLVDWV